MSEDLRVRVDRLVRLFDQKKGERNRIEGARQEAMARLQELERKCREDFEIQLAEGQDLLVVLEEKQAALQEEITAEVSALEGEGWTK